MRVWYLTAALWAGAGVLSFALGEDWVGSYAACVACCAMARTHKDDR